MKKGILLVISGPAGSGKGETVKEILRRRDDFHISVSATTRTPRDGEVEGVSYYYMTKPEFERRLAAGEILEHNVYNGNYYGTPKAGVEAKLNDGINVILEIDVNGALNVKKLFPDALLIMVVPPDYQTLEKRLRGRGDKVPEKDITDRLARAKYELSKLNEYHYLVINEDGKLEQTAQKVIGIVDATKCATSRRPDFMKEFYTTSVSLT